MKFSTGIPGLQDFQAEPWMAGIKAPEFQRACRRLEAIGFDGLDTPEHLALDAKLIPTLGARWPQAVAAMSFFAGATERMCVNTSILILPLHHPVNLAKAMATLDQLSGGRAMLSVGLGHGEAEFRALGVPWNERGKIADEYLQAMKVLWTDDVPKFAGRYVSFDGIVFEPKPIQRPFPVWIGGNSEKSLRRAVRFGTGWRPWQVGLEELPLWKDKLAALAESFGRTDPIDLHILSVPTGVGPDHKPLAGGRPQDLSTSELVDRIHCLEQLGVTWTSLRPIRGARSLDEYLDLTEARHGPVIAQCR